MSSGLKNRKAKLLEESDQYEDSLNEEFAEFSEKAINLAEKVLIIGGGALLSFLIVKAILGKDKEEDEEDERIQERIIVKSSPQQIFMQGLMNKSVLVLLELAREMIINLIKNLPEKDEA
jgi:hypothetical protein